MKPCLKGGLERWGEHQLGNNKSMFKVLYFRSTLRSWNIDSVCMRYDYNLECREWSLSKRPISISLSA